MYALLIEKSNQNSVILVILNSSKTLAHMLLFSLIDSITKTEIHHMSVIDLNLVTMHVALSSILRKASV